MKHYKLECVIKPSKLDEVRSALVQYGVSGLTTTQVSGFGSRRGHLERYRGAQYNVDLNTEIKLELLIPSDQVFAVESVLMAAAQTGEQGDGNIIVTPVDSILHIRTGERDGQL
jgi:nitrogen regulatory protein P-II 1